ncbi:concanavalin A-like lectin/glucanase [Sarocladium strictum]
MWWILLFLSLATRAVSRCECGYSVRSSEHESPLLFTDAIESDFTKTRKLGPDYGWIPQQFNVTAKDGRGRFGKTFLPENVVVNPDGDGTTTEDDGGLELVVGREMSQDAISGAEIDSKRLDLHWGSFRAGMKVTDVNGTCAAFFWYFNDTQEIDMEFLSREFNRDKDYYPINLVVQTEQSKQAGYDASKTGHFKRVNLGFDPAEDYHEYRFDYNREKVRFFADGKVLAEMGGEGMPSSGGHLIFQHWSNGNPLWSGGPPEQDAVLKVRYVRAYFNSSDTNLNDKAMDGCEKNERVCEVKNVTEGHVLDADGEAGDEPAGDDSDEDSRGARTLIMTSPMGWTATFAAMMGLLD